jgi:hypothetical protein
MEQRRGLLHFWIGSGVQKLKDEEDNQDDDQLVHLLANPVILGVPCFMVDAIHSVEDESVWIHEASLILPTTTLEEEHSTA